MRTELGTGGRLQIVPKTGRSPQSQQNDREGVPRNVVPSFVVAFNGDEITISSKKNAQDQGTQGQFPAAAPLAAVQQPVKEADSQMSQAVAVNRAGTTTYSEAVRDSGSIGPYGLNGNLTAMKRYREASSYRKWDSSTFEVTV